MKEKKKLSLGVWIMIGLVAGIVVGAILWAAMGAENATNFTASYLKPFGDIFVNLLKFIVVPLVLLSIMDGMFSMGDIGKVGKIGWKTVVYFLATRHRPRGREPLQGQLPGSVACRGCSL